MAQLNDGLLDERKFHHTDVLGSVFALSNENGQIVVGFQYDAYGVPTEFGQGIGGMVTFGSNVVTVGTTVPANPYLYTAYYRDAESLLNYARQRYYIVDQGRFTSRDSIRGFNLYAYAENGPSTKTDPTGLWSWSSFAVGVLKAVAVVAAVALVAVVVVALAPAALVTAVVTSTAFLVAATVVTVVGVAAVALQTYQVATGKDLAGNELTDEQRSEMAGEVVVGWATIFWTGSKLASQGVAHHTQTLSKCSNNTNDSGCSSPGRTT